MGIICTSIGAYGMVVAFCFHSLCLFLRFADRLSSLLSFTSFLPLIYHRVPPHSVADFVVST